MWYACARKKHFQGLKYSTVSGVRVLRGIVANRTKKTATRAKKAVIANKFTINS